MLKDYLFIKKTNNSILLTFTKHLELFKIVNLKTN